MCVWPGVGFSMIICLIQQLHNYHQELKFFHLSFLSLSIYCFTFGLTFCVAKKRALAVWTSHPDMRMSNAEEALCIFLLNSNSNRGGLQKPLSQELLTSHRPDVGPPTRAESIRVGRWARGARHWIKLACFYPWPGKVTHLH